MVQVFNTDENSMSIQVKKECANTKTTKLKSEEQIEFESHSKEVSEEQNRLRNLLSMSVNEIELSVRAANCLNNANITTVGELATKSEPEMLKYRNFGKKSLNEIKAKLEQLGLSLGMKFESRLLETAIN